MSVKASDALSPDSIIDYHFEKGAANYSRSYYSEDGKSTGVWFGKQCETLGLTPGSPVEIGQFKRLAYGQDPHTGEQLIAWRKQEGPKWVQHEGAWRDHVQELILHAVMDGVNPLRKQDHEAAVKSHGHAVDLAPTCRTERETKLLEMHAIARQTFVANLQRREGAGARAYLAKRSIKESTAETFGLGLSDSSGQQLVEKLRHYGPELMQASGLFVERTDGSFYDRFRDKLMFPIENEHGETIAFGGRRSPAETYGPKYVNSPETELYRKSEVLYNVHRATPKMAHTNQAVIVEGYVDVLAAYQAGQRNVVAPCGTALTSTQADLLKQRVDTAIINFDEDDAGRHGTERAMNTATAAGLAARAVYLNQDPADWLQGHSAKEYKEQIQHSTPLIDYLAERAGEKYNLQDVYGQVDAYHWFEESLRTVPENLRVQVSGELHAHLGVDPGAQQKKQPLEHRAGWDITFSAPKTYSLTALVGGDERLVRAHDEAVKKALAYGERAIQVKMGGNHPPETTAKLVAALFRHDTARPVDGYAAPQLHTHCVIFNLSQDATGQFRAVNPTELFRIQSAMEAVYQAELAYRARSFGYQTEHGANHAIEIQGYTEEYRQAESPRRMEIKAEQERLGQHGPQAGNYAALNTRAAKLTSTPDEIKASHREHAQQYGNQPDQVVEQARGHSNRIVTPQERYQEANQAVEYAKHRLSERTAVMEWYQIDRDALRLAKGNLTLEDVEAAKDRAIQRGEFQAVSHWRNYAPETRYTTPELQAKERKILAWMEQGKGAVPAIAGGITRDEFREKFRTELNDGQKWLVWNLILATDRMAGVQGLAGTGKTTALGALKGFAETCGYEVKGVAATGGASNELTKAGIPSNTLAGFLFERDTGKRGPRLYLLDEASLADVHQMADFLDRVKPQDRVIVIGDVKQHGSVGAGRVFAELQEAGMETFKLSKIVRQRSEDYKDVVRHLSKGEIGAALDKLDEWAHIHELSDERLRHKALAVKFVQDPYHTLGVAPDNASGAKLTEAIREEMTARGHLGEISFRTRILTHRAEMQEEDLKHAINYNPGDVLVYPIKAGPMARGDRATVLAVDVDRNKLTVIREQDGRMFTYNSSRTGTTVGVYEAEYREFARGDRIQFTRNDKEAEVTNRQLGTIEWLDNAGNAVISLDGKSKRWVGNLEQMPHIDHGYIQTSYSAQGSKAQKVLVHLDTDAPGTSRMLTQELAYVAVSRGVEEAHIYTNDQGELVEALQRLEQAPMALAPEEIAEYRERQQQEVSRSI